MKGYKYRFDNIRNILKIRRIYCFPALQVRQRLHPSSHRLNSISYGLL